jgi:transcriptional repressor NrdR
VLQQLAQMSDVAYVRFASVYRQFQSVSDFVATLEGLSREPRSKRLAAVG